jgi:hypothetical protein
MNVAPLQLKPTVRQSFASAEAPADDLEWRRALGQFLTPPDVAGFIWDLLEVIQGKRFHANTRLIDPACGEGVFLRVAHERGGLPAKSLFGADIDETLAPGWRQDSLLCDANLAVAIDCLFGFLKRGDAVSHHGAIRIPTAAQRLD